MNGAVEGWGSVCDNNKKGEQSSQSINVFWKFVVFTRIYDCAAYVDNISSGGYCDNGFGNLQNKRFAWNRIGKQSKCESNNHFPGGGGGGGCAKKAAQEKRDIGKRGTRKKGHTLF